jgi:hypothetical protein
MRKLFRLNIQSKKVTIPVLVITSLLLSFFLFPVITSFVAQPYLVSLEYNINDEGTYTLHFNHYIFQDPSTTFYSPEGSRGNLDIINTGPEPIKCRIYNLGASASGVLLHHLPVLDQLSREDRPGMLLDDEGQLNAVNQPFRTIFLKPGEQLKVSFQGFKRDFECLNNQPKTSFLINGKVQVNHYFSIKAASQKNNKTALLFIPPYAFGSYEIKGPAGFQLIKSTLSHINSTQTIPWGKIPFPYLSLMMTIIASATILILFYCLIRYIISLFRDYQPDLNWNGFPFFARNDWIFLIISGLTILTFTGSVPPISMWDSTGYVETANNLHKLFSTFTYPVYRSPGYAIFIWLARKLMGPGYGLILVQELLFFITSFLLYKTVEHFTRGNRLAAWTAGLLYILNPLNLIYSQFIQPEGMWRDLLVIWAFSLVLIMKRSTWGVILGGAALGILWLSRNSAVPSILLCVSIGALAAWKKISLNKYFAIIAVIILLLYAPYFIYLRAAGTMNQAYFRVLQNVGSFVTGNNTLDTSTTCFSNFQRDFAERSNDSLPWMKISFFSPLNQTDPNAKDATLIAQAFEKCVYPANYLRFPKQQLGILAGRITSFLWKPDLLDMDLWNYGKIYSRDEFLSPEAPSTYLNLASFAPYFYSEKWNSQDFPSVWKYIFIILYASWPYIELVVLVLTISFLLVIHILGGLRKINSLKDITLLMTALLLLFLADAVIYSVFGIAFSRRIMLPVTSMMPIVLGSSLAIATRALPKRTKPPM